MPVKKNGEMDIEIESHTVERYKSRIRKDKTGGRVGRQREIKRERDERERQKRDEEKQRREGDRAGKKGRERLRGVSSDSKYRRSVDIEMERQKPGPDKWWRKP